jgi:hypothetical protein
MDGWEYRMYLEEMVDDLSRANGHTPPERVAPEDLKTSGGQSVFTMREVQVPTAANTSNHRV